MPRTFEIFHLSLIERERNFFTEVATREEWLRKVFSGERAFVHRTKDFLWLPVASSLDRTVVIGHVLRRSTRAHHQPPEDGGAEILTEEWQGAIVVIDPTHHDDGQKLSFEKDETIGSPSGVLSSLVGDINRIGNAPYAIEIKQIFDKKHFWDWASKHGNRAQRITFDFVVPNMWDTARGLDQDLKDVGKQTGARRAKVSFQSDDGVKLDSPQIRDGVEYASRGGGSITARALDSDRYTSTIMPKKTTIPLSGKSRQLTFNEIKRWLNQILDRGIDDNVDGANRTDDGSPLD